MKKILLFVFLLINIFAFKLYSQEKGFVLEITFDIPKTYKTIYLWNVRGVEEDVIDSISLLDKKAIWKLDSIPETGEYRISTKLDYENGWYFIIHQEPYIHLHINWRNIIESKSSEENRLYFFLNRYETRLDSLYARGDYYYQTKRYDKLAEVRLNIKKNIWEYHKATDSLMKLYPSSFAVKVQYSSVPPIFDLYKKEHPDQSYKDEYSFLKRHLFDRIDKNDPRLIRTRVISRAIEFYLNNLLDTTTEKEYIKACDFILSSFSWNDEQFNYVLRLLMNTFEDSPYEGVFLHLFDLYSHHSSCDGGIPDEYERRAIYLTSLKIGTDAPALEGYDQKDNKVTLAQLRGKKILLVFWYSKCEHCHQILPYVVETMKSYPNIVFLTFSLDKNKDDWFEGIQALKLPWPSITDFKGYDGENAIRWAVFGTPLFYVINEEGKIIAKPKDLEELKAALK